MFMNKEGVLKFLPHRDPFLFIDTVTSVLREGEKEAEKLAILEKKDLINVQVVAHVRTLPSWPIFQGHFPGNPILPGVVQIEMMAQASCFSIARLLEDPFAIKLEVALLKVESAKFRKPIRPGMDLKITAICRKIRQNMMSYDCLLEHDQEIMAEASLLAMANF